MFGSLVLNWYPKRNPSEEIKRTTGLSSFLSGRATDLWKDGDLETWFRERTGFWEEKKRKAKAEAAERATQVTIRRDVKTKQLEMELVEELESESEESVLLSRSAIDWLGGFWSSSGVLALGFFADNASPPEIIASLFSVTGLVDVCLKSQKVASFDQSF